MRLDFSFTKISLLSTFVILLGIGSQTFAIIDENEITQLLEVETLDDVNVDNYSDKSKEGELPNLKNDIAKYNPKSTKSSVEGEQPVHEQESQEEIMNWMHSKGITTFKSFQSFNPNSFVTKEQMSKFAVSFALMIKKQRNMNPSCGFKDIYNGQKNLIPYLLSACNMNIIKGSNGYIEPSKSLTKAETITIIMRLIRNDIRTDANPRYKNVYNTAKAYGITNDKIENMNKKTTRWEVAVMLRRAYKFIKE